MLDIVWLDIAVLVEVLRFINFNSNLITSDKRPKIKTKGKGNPGRQIHPKTGASGLFYGVDPPRTSKTEISYQNSPQRQDNLLQVPSTTVPYHPPLRYTYCGRLSFPVWITDPPGRSRIVSPMTSLGRSRGCCGRVQRYDVEGEEDRRRLLD